MSRNLRGRRVLEHLGGGPQAKVGVLGKGAWIETNCGSPSWCFPARESTPWKPRVGTPGSCGWQAARTLYSLQTGMTRSRKYVIRSQRGDVGVRGPFRPWSEADPRGASASRHVPCREPPRPGVLLVRKTPRHEQALYLNAGNQVLAISRDHLLNVFGCRDRSGTFPSMIVGAAGSCVYSGSTTKNGQKPPWGRSANSVLFRGHASAADRRRSKLLLRQGPWISRRWLVDPMPFEVLQHPGSRWVSAGSPRASSPIARRNALWDLPALAPLRPRGPPRREATRPQSSMERDERPSLHHDDSFAESLNQPGQPARQNSHGSSRFHCLGF